ncbi:hypothetical protein GCM10010270_28960 [Streptomyces violaceus]|nr:hypothetical protein GCM10010270_28960 [Streptomyces janthinus]
MTPGYEPRAGWCDGSACQERDSARDGDTEGGKGRSDGPLPCQAQHAADHTRPKSMWTRLTRRCSAFMRLLEQDISLFVNHGSDAGRELSGSDAWLTPECVGPIRSGAPR